MASPELKKPPPPPEPYELSKSNTFGLGSIIKSITSLSNRPGLFSIGIAQRGGHRLSMFMSFAGVESEREYFRDGTDVGFDSVNNNPINKLCCSTCLIILLLLSLLLACIKANFLIIFANTDENDFSNSFVWNYGYLSKVFNDGSNLSSTVTSRDNLMLTYTNRFYNDVRGFTIIYLLLFFVFMCYNAWILFLRNEFELLLYIRCCCCKKIKLPQRPTLFFSFKAIKLMGVICVIEWILLGIYGMNEFKLYVPCDDIEGNAFCIFAFYPHYGIGIIIFITLFILLGVEPCLKKMDLKFEKKHIHYYYPENISKMKSKDCNIDLKILVKMFKVCFKLLLLLTILWCMQRSQILNIIVKPNDKGFQTFTIGLDIKASIDTINSYEFGSLNNVIYIISLLFKVLLPLYMIALFGIGTFFAYRIIKFNNIFTFMLFFVRIYSISQFILFDIFIFLYYVLIGANFIQNWRTDDEFIKSNIVYDINAEIKKLYLIPGWGLFIILYIQFYFVKLIWLVWCKVGTSNENITEFQLKHNVELHTKPQQAIKKWDQE